jgi:4-hydroxy-2-oxoheptanedioate aldolase
LKQRIRAGEPLRVLPALPNATRGEIEALIALGPFDVFWLDGQHAPLCDRELADFCCIAGELGKPVQLRVKHPRQAHLLGNFLDLGPLSIVLPLVQDEETVVDAIDAFYFPPAGRRSWGATGYQFKDVPDRLAYAEWWNNNEILCVQLESVQAILNVRRLARPGVDWITFGPNDLMFDLEMRGHRPFTTVDECVQYVVRQLQGMPVTVFNRVENEQRIWLYSNPTIT